MSSADDGHKEDHANKDVGNGKVSIGAEQERGRQKQGNIGKEELSSDSESGGGGEHKYRSKQAVRKEKVKIRRRKESSSSDEEDSSDDERRRKKRRLGRKTRRREKNDRSSSSSDDDGDSSEDEEHRKGKKQKRRMRRKKSDTSDSSVSDSSEDDHRRRKQRRLKGDGLRKKGHVESETSGSEEDKRRRKRRDKDRKKRRHSSDRKKSKSLPEAERKKAKKEKKKKLKEKLGTGAVTDRYGKYGVIREVDMWNKRPEFGAWLHEVKHVSHCSAILAVWPPGYLGRSSRLVSCKCVVLHAKFWIIMLGHRRDCEDLNINGRNGQGNRAFRSKHLAEIVILQALDILCSVCVLASSDSLHQLDGFILDSLRRKRLGVLTQTPYRAFEPHLFYVILGLP